MNACVRVIYHFAVAVKSAARSAQQSAGTRFQIDQNTVVGPSTQLGFYRSQERTKILPTVLKIKKHSNIEKREKAALACVGYCSVPWRAL